MLLNKLYQFIINETRSNNIKSNQHLSVERFNIRSKKRHILYELPEVQQKISLEDKSYTLLSHHVSIYEEESSKIATLSQYHYTAYFNDDIGDAFQLHVYFDRNDQMVIPALFSKKSEDGGYTNLKISEESVVLLNQIGIDNSFSFMTELRTQYLDKLDTLIKQFNDLEKKMSMLSLDLMQNRKQYCFTLDHIVEVLTLLSSYDYNNHNESLLTIFNHIKRSLPSVEPQAQPFENEDILNEKIVPMETVDCIDKKIALTHSVVNDSIEKANQLQKSFRYDKGITAKNKVDLFMDFDRQVSDVLLLTLDDNYHLTVKNLTDIKSLLMVRNFEGRVLLTNMLRNSEFELAELLKNFVPYLSEKLIGIVLKKGNELILDFLLKHGQFAINTTLIDSQQTPVLYCYYEHTEENSKIGCLSVLIKHNVSLMVKIGGLPLAHHLISTNHPLLEALTNQSDKAVGRPQFFKELVYHLEMFCNNCNDEIVKNKLLTDIEAYKLSINILSKNVLARQHSIISINQTTIKNILSQVELTPIERLKNDSEFQAQYTKFLGVINEYFNTLPTREQRRSAAIDSDGAKFFESILKKADFTLPNIKQIILDKLDTLMRLFPLLTAFRQVSTIIAKEKTPVVVQLAEKQLADIFVKLEKIAPSSQLSDENKLLHSIFDFTETKLDDKSKSKVKSRGPSVQNDNTPAELASILGFLSLSPREDDNNNNNSFDNYTFHKKT